MLRLDHLNGEQIVALPTAEVGRRNASGFPLWKQPTQINADIHLDHWK